MYACAGVYASATSGGDVYCVISIFADTAAGVFDCTFAVGHGACVGSTACASECAISEGVLADTDADIFGDTTVGVCAGTATAGVHAGVIISSLISVA